MDQKTLLRLAKTHGTPLVVVDHQVLRENYAQFSKQRPSAAPPPVVPCTRCAIVLPS